MPQVKYHIEVVDAVKDIYRVVVLDDEGRVENITETNFRDMIQEIIDLEQPNRGLLIRKDMRKLIRSRM